MIWYVRIWLDEQKRFESSAESCQRRCRRNHWWQAVPHLRVSNRKCSAAYSGAANRRVNEAVAAGRAKPPATWKVGNVTERANVRRCTAVNNLVYQDGNLGPNAFRNTQPMKADEYGSGRSSSFSILFLHRGGNSCSRHRILKSDKIASLMKSRIGRNGCAQRV